MITVFRVEHVKTRIGPYQTNNVFTQELAAKLEFKPRLKAPFYDGLLLSEIPFFYKFGCLTLTDLREWFLLSDWLNANLNVVQTLGILGFRIAEYSVCRDNVRISNSKVQVMFDADDYDMVVYHDIRLLLDQELALAS